MFMKSAVRKKYIHNDETIEPRSPSKTIVSLDSMRGRTWPTHNGFSLCGRVGGVTFGCFTSVPACNWKD